MLAVNVSASHRFIQTGGGGHGGEVTGDKAAKQATAALVFVVADHWGPGPLRRPKQNVFHVKLGHLQPCMLQQKWVFYRRLLDIYQPCLQ